MEKDLVMVTPGLYVYSDSFIWRFWSDQGHTVIDARRGDMCTIITTLNGIIIVIIDGQLLRTGPVPNFVEAWERVL